MLDGERSRLQWIGLGLIGLYAIVIAAAIAWIGPDLLVTADGFYRFTAVALAASPLALVAFTLSRLARGRSMTATLAAACSLLLLLRMARGEATAGGILFALAFLVVLLVLELAISRWERKRARAS
jgi:hypothetical protein